MEVDGPVFDLRGNLHQCYPAYKTLVYCVNSRIFENVECAQEKGDYLECYRGSKRKQAVLMLNQQIYAKKVLSIPIYNPSTNSFITEVPLDN